MFYARYYALAFFNFCFQFLVTQLEYYKPH